MTELKEQVENSIKMVENFNTPLSITYAKTIQKISKETEELNNIKKPTRSNKHIENTLPNNKSIQILLKRT